MKAVPAALLLLLALSGVVHCYVNNVYEQDYFGSSVPLVTLRYDSSFKSYSQYEYFDTRYASVSSRSPGCGGAAPVDVWVKIRPSQSGELRFTTCQGLYTGFDTRIAVWRATSSGDPTSVIACSDDNCSLSGGTRFRQSTLAVDVTAGQTYLLQLGGWSWYTGIGYWDAYIYRDMDPNPDCECQMTTSNTCVRVCNRYSRSLAEDLAEQSVKNAADDLVSRDAEDAGIVVIDAMNEVDKGYEAVGGETPRLAASVVAAIVAAALVLTVLPVVVVVRMRKQRRDAIAAPDERANDPSETPAPITTVVE